MKRKIILLIGVLFIVIGGVILYFRLTNDNIPTEREKRLGTVGAFVNVPENPEMGRVDSQNPVYWHNRDYAFFQGDVSEGYVSYLVERTGATEHKFEDESMNWTYETYEVRFMIYRSNYKDIHYVMGYQDAFYTFKDSLITRYDLKSEKIKKRRIKVSEVLGVSNQSIYIRNIDGYFKVSLDLKDKEFISKGKLPSKYKVKAVEYSFEVEKQV